LAGGEIAMRVAFCVAASCLSLLSLRPCDAVLCGDQQIPWPSRDALTDTDWSCQARKEATAEALAFLNANMPPWDLLNAESLQGGILPTTVKLALDARQAHPWAAQVPKDIWQDWVLPYASVNEARSNWREHLATLMSPLVQKATTASEVATTLNRHLWWVLRDGGSAIHFKDEQTPLIYDPMSIIVFGYASCTGVSILLVDALRSVGLAARVLGTPAWHGKVADGDHTWVEVWLGDKEGWAFIEAAPAGPGETLTNPCDKWFCNAAHFPAEGGATEVFAARFDRRQGTTVYPMAWDLGNDGIPGVDRSEYYNKVCRECSATSATTKTQSTQSRRAEGEQGAVEILRSLQV